MSKKRILIVDDSVVIRRSLANALARDADLEVVGSASNGRIALMKIPLLRPDVVTLDVEMPDMDGLQALAEIRKRYPQLPVIMISP
jgi:two-component system chemotaxis response regulator CheB